MQVLMGTGSTVASQASLTSLAEPRRGSSMQVHMTVTKLAACNSCYNGLGWCRSPS